MGIVGAGSGPVLDESAAPVLDSDEVEPTVVVVASSDVDDGKELLTPAVDASFVVELLPRVSMSAPFEPAPQAIDETSSSRSRPGCLASQGS